jgi:hypothetical protein
MLIHRAERDDDTANGDNSDTTRYRAQARRGARRVGVCRRHVIAGRLADHALWRRHGRRAECARGGVDGRDADTVYRVIEIKPAETSDATPNGATFACPAGVPEVHTHPPATCYSDRKDQCYPGGADAYSCQPSREDARKLIQRGDAFAIVQCDRHAFVFYYPSQFAPSGPPHAPEELAEVRIREPVSKPLAH